MRITLLTDFGTRDGYVGAMKGVIASRLSDAIIDDIGHDITPGDVEGGAWALGAYWRRWPEGTVHVVVVDPGVGTSRHALAIEADGRFLVGPDNGVLSWALRDAGRVGEMHVLELPADTPVSATFHGRDLFAPSPRASPRAKPSPRSVRARSASCASPGLSRCTTPRASTASSFTSIASAT